MALRCRFEAGFRNLTDWMPTESHFPPALQIAVIEDDLTMRTLLTKLIGKQEDLEVCGAWSSGEEALAALDSLRPDVVVVDLELPGISGEDCIRTLSVNLPCAAFVVLTIHEDAGRVFGALQAGANGYLLKGSAPAVIVAGIHAAHRGGAPLSPEVAGLVIRAFQNNSPKKTPVPLPSLSPRERQILELLATGISPKEAAAELNLSYETVRDYLKQIYQKLHVRSRTEAVLRFLESGEA
jgi:DNA-binding NarL/FixJ family response regulator